MNSSQNLPVKIAIKKRRKETNSVARDENRVPVNANWQSSYAIDFTPGTGKPTPQQGMARS